MQPEVKWLMEYLDAREMLEDMQKCIHEALHWARMNHGYDSKNARIREWSPDEFQLYDIFCHIFAGTILHPQGMTYQAMIGYISGNIQCKDPLDRAKCAAELIAIAYQCDLVVITKVSDKTMMVTTEYVLDEDIPTFPKHMPEFRKPQSIAFIPILGNRFKQHGNDVCIDHINRMNSIPLTLEHRVIQELEETTKANLETDEQKEQWEDFKFRSKMAYAEVQAQGDRFYLMHNNDTRGRCYCTGYYINYQGSSYKKAIVQLANKELVQL